MEGDYSRRMIKAIEPGTEMPTKRHARLRRCWSRHRKEDRGEGKGLRMNVDWLGILRLRSSLNVRAGIRRSFRLRGMVCLTD